MTTLYWDTEPVPAGNARPSGARRYTAGVLHEGERYFTEVTVPLHDFDGGPKQLRFEQARARANERQAAWAKKLMEA